jgi:glutamine synthetase type III
MSENVVRSAVGADLDAALPGLPREITLPDDLWPLPTYRDVLFIK